MKKMIGLIAAVGALAAVSAAPANASQGCRTVKCFNNRITVLQSELSQVASALNCLQPVAVSRYPGYDYNGYAAATTALDFTESGDQVSEWVLSIQPGTCGAPHSKAAVPSASTSPGAAARDASPFRPFQAVTGITLDGLKAGVGGR